MTVFFTILQAGCGLFVCFLLGLVAWFLFHVLRGAMIPK
jgi:hypothetical protein